MNYFLSFVWILLLAQALVEAKHSLEEHSRCPSDLLRLPKWIEPKHYDLIISTELDEKQEFEGTVQIDLEIGEFDPSDSSSLKANQIALNADDRMNITQVSYRELSSSGNDIEDGEYIEVVSVCKQSAHHIIVITLARDLLPHSKAQLYLSFSREMGTEMTGYYRIEYKTPNGESRYMASTQFEADHARMAFPCFDEPAFKATFALTLVIPEDRQALSNMHTIHEQTLPITEERPKARKLIRFMDTPKMSSYLLAFVVGQFDYLEHELENGRVRIRVYTPAGQAQLGQLVLDTASRTLPLMEDYFDEPFPLKKLDFVSIPKLDSVAMENWGLITFADYAMLMDENQCSKRIKNQLILTVVHELGHQWFGNLVTMDWWDDLWLNEAFATWVELNMTNSIHPELEEDFVFLLDQYTLAHEYDQLPSEPSVGFRGLEDASLVDDLMGPIVYCKGGTIIKYLHNEFVGPEMFKDAIRNYVNEHKYANTKGEDLWRAMEHSSSKAVREFMESWLFQSGHPLVTASIDGSSLLLNQQRFHPMSIALDEEKDKQLWMIPILILLSDNKGRQEFMEVNLNDRSESFKLPSWFKPQKGHWMKLNVNSTGMYKVMYSQDLFANLRKPVEKLMLPPVDRLNLLIEMKFLYDADYVSNKDFEKFLYWFKGEQHMAVLEFLQNAVNAYSPEGVKKLQHDLFSHVSQQYGYKSSEDEEVSLLEERARETIMFNLVETSHQKTIKLALKTFDEHKKENKIISPFLRTSIYLAVAKHGTVEQKAQLIDMVKEVQLREERDRLMFALARSNDPELKRIFEMLNLNQEIV